MLNHPFKLILRRRRGVVQLEIKVPAAGSAWYVKERVNLGSGTLIEAINSLPGKDLTATPLIKAAVVLASTQGEPGVGG